MNTTISILKDYFLVLVISWIFIFILESIGFYFLKLSKTIIDRTTNKVNNNQHYTFGLNTLVGGIIWTMILFLLGLLNVIHSNEVFLYSIIFLLIAIIRNILKFKNEKLTFRFNLLTLSFIFGLVFSYCLLTFYAFKPVTSFDALWYHFPISKAFLMQGNIDYLANTTRYSVHPYMNFFWYLFFFALPKVPIVLKGLSINIFLINLVFISVLEVTNKIRKDFNFGLLFNFLAPIFIACLPLILDMSSWGYNDPFGYCYGIGLFIVIYNIFRTQTISLMDLCCGLLMCCGLFMLKIFFAVLGFIGFIVLVIKYIELNRWNKKNIIQIILITLIAFVLYIFPWLLRSYLWTGKILYPIGAPGLVDDAYQFIGAESESKFWGIYWNNRFAGSFFGFWLTIFGPLVLTSIISLFFNIEKWLKELIFVGLFAFYLTYIINIVGEPRYQFATIPFLVIPGLIALHYLYQYSKLSGGMLSVAILIILLISPIRTYITDDHKKIDDFYNKKTTIKNYMQLRTGDYNINYFRNENTDRPSDLADNEPILVYNLARGGYIDNPIIDIGVHRKYLYDNSNINELNNKIRQLKVKYMLTRLTPTELCLETQTKDKSSCSSESSWTKVVYDDQNKVWWWKLN
jgi:hypothetical protein